MFLSVLSVCYSPPLLEKLSVSQTARFVFDFRFFTDRLLCSAGHLWKVGEWTEGDQHQPGSPEEELSGTDGAQTHPSSDSAVLWRGVTHSGEQTQHTSRWTVVSVKWNHKASWCVDRWRIPTCWRSHRHWWRATREVVGPPSDWGKPSSAYTPDLCNTSYCWLLLVVGSYEQWSAVKHQCASVFKLTISLSWKVRLKLKQPLWDKYLSC